MTEGKLQTISDYLSIEMTSVDIGKGFKMIWYGLINNIFNTCVMKYCKSSPTLTSVVVPPSIDYLGNEANLQDEWKYASVIGMLMYAESYYRPEISFVVHQCARFTHNFKHSHENAILSIFKYIKATNKNRKHEGLIIYPSNKIQVDCYVYKYFDGLYGQE